MFRTHTDPTIEMMQALGFTQDDLENNRKGQLSVSQREQMALRKQSAIRTGQRASKSTPLVMLYVIVVLGIIAVAFISTGSFQYVQDALGEWAIPAMIGIAALILLIVIRIPRQFQRSVAEYNQGAASMPLDYVVLSVMGEMKVRTRSFGSNVETPDTVTLYYLNVGGKDFSVSESRYKALKNAINRGAVYRLYYAEYGKTTFILSAEAAGNR